MRTGYGYQSRTMHSCSMDQGQIYKQSVEYCCSSLLSSLVNIQLVFPIKYSSCEIYCLCCYWTLVQQLPQHFPQTPRILRSCCTEQLNILRIRKLILTNQMIFLILKVQCCSNHSLEQHLQYAYFSKAHRRLFSSGDYKKTQQGVLTALLLFLYKLQIVYATTICLPHVYSIVTMQDCASCSNIHVSYMWQQCGVHAS